MFDRLEQFGLMIARIGVWSGGAMMIAAAFIIGTEVVLRKLFLITLGGADEMANYALAISTVWALSFALLQRAHIRVDVIYVLLPKPVSAVLDILSLLSLLVFAGTLTWYGAGVWQTSWDFGSTANTPLATPLWIPQGLWMLGLIGFSFTIVLLLGRSLQALVGRDFAKINEIAGTLTVDEELKEELGAVERADQIHMKNTQETKVEAA
ncbi:MAG: TRAP transporter small permease [Sneathiella sp.]